MVHARNGKRMLQIAGIAVLVGMLPAASAAMISGNFCSVANVENPPAGYMEAQTWNDFTSAAGYGGVGSSNSVLYEDTTLSGVTVSWAGSAGISQNTNDNVNRPGDIDDGHDEMMTGYLQASKWGSGQYVPYIRLEVSDIDVEAFGGSYDVLLYFDGDGDVEGTSGHVSFVADDGVGTYPTYYGRDDGQQYALLNDGSDPVSVYSQITSTNSNNPTAGNYVRFSGLTGTDLEVTMAGMAGEQGVALNGFQIVPEPASLLLVGLGLVFLTRRN